MPTNAQIRRRLLARRFELLARYRDELDRVEEELSTRETEDVERASEQWDARVLSSLGDADIRAITEVVAALKRLDEGTYGECVHCGERIGKARLEVLPEAAACIACASTFERAA